MYRRMNKTEKKELEEKNKKFLRENPGYYDNTETADIEPEPDHSDDIDAAKKGRRIN